MYVVFSDSDANMEFIYSWTQIMKSTAEASAAAKELTAAAQRCRENLTNVWRTSLSFSQYHFSLSSINAVMRWQGFDVITSSQPAFGLHLLSRKKKKKSLALLKKKKKKSETVN